MSCNHDLELTGWAIPQAYIGYQLINPCPMFYCSCCYKAYICNFFDYSIIYDNEKFPTSSNIKIVLFP